MGAECSKAKCCGYAAQKEEVHSRVVCASRGPFEEVSVYERGPKKKREPHGLLTLYPALAAVVRFIDLAQLRALPVPLPRCQDLPEECFCPLMEGDLLVAVSHAWTNQTHPDPSGKKMITMCDVLLASERVQRVSMVANVALFFDFLSIPQRPFLPGQSPRTEEETVCFDQALKLMHFVYLHADVLLHMDGNYETFASTSRGKVTVAPEELDGVLFCSVGQTWQIDSVLSDSSHDIRPGDEVAGAVDGDLPTAGDSPCRPSGALTINRRHYGASNRTPASDRGWVYLERFITMARVAMIGLERFDQCVLCTGTGVRKIIDEGARTLVAAVEAGRLAQVLPGFTEELQRKKFSASSTDKRQADASQVSNDATIVCGIMRKVVQHLRDSWQEVRASVVDDAIFDVAARLYELVQADQQLRDFYRGTKLELLQRNQGLFLREVWLGRRPELQPAVHRIWHIQSEHFEAFMGHLDTALRECFGNEQSARTEAVRETMRSYKPLIVLHAERLPPPNLSDTAALARWLRDASQAARLGVLPYHCALQAAKRLQRAHAGEVMDRLPCPAMSTPAAARLVEVLPEELQAAGHAAWSSGATRAPPAPAASSSPSLGFLEEFMDRFHERLAEDEVVGLFFTREEACIKHIKRMQASVLFSLFQTGATQKLRDQLLRVHRQLVISDFEFDRFLEVMAEVGAETDPAFAKLAVYLLEGLRKCIVQDNAGLESKKDTAPERIEHI